jgi:predicted translin family RNA/ssDNA-binding protein
MTPTTEFFADFAYDQYQEFVEAELREMFLDTTPQDENFLLDVPF